jgi:hypothetical protein
MTPKEIPYTPLRRALIGWAIERDFCAQDGDRMRMEVAIYYASLIHQGCVLATLEGMGSALPLVNPSKGEVDRGTIPD